MRREIKQVMIQRPYYEDMLRRRLAEDRRFIQVIAGPRQVGKTTLVQQVLGTIQIPYSFYTADTEQEGIWISEIWQKERMEMRFTGQKERLLVIDEVQKIRNWSEYVKKQWDEDTWNKTNIKLLLLGSSRLMIMHGLTESLAGRFELIKMTHWTYAEMHEAFKFDMNQYIYFGGYPGAANLIQDEHRWRRYVRDSIAEPSITKDVLETSNVYKPALLRQIFELGCSYSTELLSLTKLQGQLQDAGNVTTIASYLQLLKEANLLAGLYKYANDNSRKRQSVPKFQVYNNALYNAYSRNSFKRVATDPKLWGHQVESAVGAYLLSQAELYDMNVWFWRQNDDEVDFVLEWDNEIAGIEVKSNHEKMTRGLVTFRNLFHPESALIVGHEGISIETFLQTDISKLFESKFVGNLW